MDLVEGADHRQQDAKLRAARGCDDGAQLCGEGIRVIEQQLDASLLDCRQEGRRLVCTEVEDAHRGDAPLQQCQDRGKLPPMILLARPGGCGQECELGAQETRTLGTGL